MSEEPIEFEVGELLRMIGKARTPEPSVLEEDAREALWSAIASEMLGTGLAGEQVTVTAREERRRSRRRPRASQPDGERGMSMGGGEDQER